MTDITDTGLEEFAGQIKDQVESFLLAVRAIAVEADGPRSISLLLLEMSQISLAGARLGAQVDFDPEGEYQPDVGPELDLDDVRRRLADILGEIDTYSFVFDPYLPEVVESQLSDEPRKPLSHPHPDLSAPAPLRLGTSAPGTRCRTCRGPLP